MERGEETDWRWWCVLFLVQVKTLQNWKRRLAPARIEWLVNASSKDATQRGIVFVSGLGLVITL